MNNYNENTNIHTKTLALGEIKIIWKCFYCGYENKSKMDEKGKKVICQNCNNSSELWIK